MSDTTIDNIDSGADVVESMGKAIGKALSKNPVMGAAIGITLTGQLSWATSAASLGRKISDGTATSEDFAELALNTASVLAALGIIAGIANPWTLTALGIAGVVLTLWENDDEIIDYIKDLFGDAKTASSPIILDMNGDGVGTSTLTQGTFFDHDGNGFAQKSAWVDKNDYLLARDINGNGIIDNGSELFGDNTLLANGQKAANGFAALAQFDSNGDGTILTCWPMSA